jgi:hypothetical protein
MSYKLYEKKKMIKNRIRSIIPNELLKNNKEYNNCEIRKI